ncbi:MAG: VanZ family protein [Phycisphaeraceae bacterium]|nr:VanZ family protein [Phycisphaeraceae bacterium]
MIEQNHEQMTGQPVLWRRPWWLRAGVLAGAWALLVAYGSLIPFDFHLHEWRFENLALGGQMSAPPLDDVLLNLALYVPLGVLLRLSWKRWTCAAAGVIALSFALESVQSLSPQRVSSWQDFAANAGPGVVAAALTPWLIAGFRVTVFATYRRIAQPIAAVWSWLHRQRRRPTMMLAMVAVNVLLIGAWSSTLAAPVRPSAQTAINWLPFGEHFARSYDKAIGLAGESLLAYCVLGMLGGAVLMRRSQRWPLLWLTLGVTVVVGGLEMLRRMTGRDQADITEPLLAVVAVGMVFATAWLFVHAVRCSCRRKVAVPVAHDRRRRPHDYSFAVRNYNT